VSRCQQPLHCMLPNNDATSRPFLPESGVIDRNKGWPRPS
jgi:hypothetical protein